MNFLNLPRPDKIDKNKGHKRRNQEKDKRRCYVLEYVTILQSQALLPYLQFLRILGDIFRRWKAGKFSEGSEESRTIVKPGFHGDAF